MGRSDALNLLKGTIDIIAAPAVITLNGAWGTGKTNLILAAIHELESSNHFTVYFNAWETDFGADPLLGMAAALQQKTAQISGPVAKSGQLISKYGSHIVKRTISLGLKAASLGIADLDKELDDLKNSAANALEDASHSLVDAFMREREAIELFKKQLQQLGELLSSQGRRDRIIFFIDDLDRCRPNYSIELLERIKHTFDVPSVVFVLAVDKSQLEVSTRAVYGQGIKAAHYLQRFIDLELDLPATIPIAHAKHLLERFNSPELTAVPGKPDLAIDCFARCFTAFSDREALSLRAREKAIARFLLINQRQPLNSISEMTLAVVFCVLRSNKDSTVHELLRHQPDNLSPLLTEIKSSGSNAPERPFSNLLQVFLNRASHSGPEPSRLANAAVEEIESSNTLRSAPFAQAIAHECEVVGNSGHKPIAAKVRKILEAAEIVTKHIL